MRQGQQNRRGRGRNNNNNGNNNQNRKGQNPLTRSFESTGPDVKLRGTPAHIAEKYIALARDAQSSGDPVLAENYLQHAEHYNRIIMAFREQQMAQGGGDMQNGMGRPRPAGFGEPVSMNDDFGDEDGDFNAEGQPQQPYAAQPSRGEGRAVTRGSVSKSAARAPSMKGAAVSSTIATVTAGTATGIVTAATVAIPSGTTEEIATVIAASASSGASRAATVPSV